MHCYEIIPEGTVCKLYLDLEFYKPANKGADGKVMVSRLIRVCCSNFYFLICYCQSRLLHIQRLRCLSDLLFSYFFQGTKASIEPFFGVCSMFVTSWWKFMESHLPSATSWTLTPVQRRSSVGISSSISTMQFSKTTYIWVRSVLSKGNFLWHVVLKSYSLCGLGRFIHGILQPILSTLKGGRSHNSGVNSSEMRFGLVFRSVLSNIASLLSTLGDYYFWFLN